MPGCGWAELLPIPRCRLRYVIHRSRDESRLRDRDFVARPVGHRQIHRAAVDRIDERQPALVVDRHRPQIEAGILAQPVDRAFVLALLLDVAITAADALQAILRVEAEQVGPALPLQYARVELPFVAGQHEHLQLAARHLRERRAEVLRTACFEHDLRDRLLVGEPVVRVEIQRHYEEQRGAREQQRSHHAAARGSYEARAKQALAGECQQQQAEDSDEQDDGIGAHVTKPVSSRRSMSAASAAMSRSSRWSYGRYATLRRMSAWTRCNGSVVCSGCSLSIACAAASTSMARTCAVFAQIRCNLKPAHGAMLT